MKRDSEQNEPNEQGFREQSTKQHTRQIVAVDFTVLAAAGAIYLLAQWEALIGSVWWTLGSAVTLTLLLTLIYIGYRRTWTGFGEDVRHKPEKKRHSATEDALGLDGTPDYSGSSRWRSRVVQ